MTTVPRISFPTLTRLVTDAIERSLRRVRHRTRGESLYVFAIYLSPLYGYAGLSYNTGEALDRAAAGYVEEKLYRSKRVAAEQLRRNPDDWEYHELHAAAFQPTNELLKHVPDKLRALSVERFRDYCGKLDQAFVDALKEAERRGLFAELANRESLVLALVMGDLDEKWLLRNARKLNS